MLYYGCPEASHKQQKRKIHYCYTASCNALNLLTGRVTVVSNSTKVTGTQTSENSNNTIFQTKLPYLHNISYRNILLNLWKHNTVFIDIVTLFDIVLSAIYLFSTINAKCLTSNFNESLYQEVWSRITCT